MGRGRADDQAVGLEAGQHPAQVPGVEAEVAAQRGHLGAVAGVGQLEDHPGFGQRVRRAQQPVGEHADDAGVEPVERADLGDG